MVNITQKRDDDILMAIQDVGDGTLARRHLKSMFWADKSLRAMQKVMSRLYRRELIYRTTVRYHQIKQPRSEPVYWLGWRGILRVAGQIGVDELYEPKNDGENQMRILERELRRQGIRWVREPPTVGKLEHHFTAVDFRLMVQRAVDELPSVSVAWINESIFRSPKMDKVKFTFKERDGRLVKAERGVCPDGALLLCDAVRERRGESHELLLLVEIDIGTHPVRSRFASYKAAPYAAYIGSPAFRARFGTDADTADWLIVTKGKDRRMRHLMDQTQQTVGQGAQWFLFTTWDRLKGVNVLTAPVWHRAGVSSPFRLTS